MRVLILTPTSFPDISGNAVTAERWRMALANKGTAVRVISGKGLNAAAFMDHVRRFRPDMVHVHHAFRCGALIADSEPALAQAGVAIVASPGGTDINEDLLDPAKKSLVQRVFEMACVIIAQSPQIMEHFNQHLPSLSSRIVFVPKSVCWFGEEDFDLRSAAGCSPGNILFLLPSGIRPVKGNLECLRSMARVHALRPQARLAVAGASVDEAYAVRFRQEISAHADFAFWINCIPSAAMRSAYRAADIVLNTSFSEGLSNSLMEAIAAGKPVLASDIEGNRWPVLGTDEDSATGLLYDLRNPEDFVEKAVRLIDNANLRAALSRAAHAKQSQWPDAGVEADGLLAAYREATVRFRSQKSRSRASRSPGC
ncbi:MAG: glycosyltransferase family 4 protein [Acidobacteriota bacterium]|nr:glycosyltransferase family 4 protein [Acidobacteriota bacterium]